MAKRRAATPNDWEPRTDDGSDAWHHRVDRGVLLASHARADGTLLVEGYAAREGVLEYLRGDGSIFRELVTTETLADAARGLGRAPVTLEHPDPRRHPQGVTPDNVAELQVGDTDGEVFVEDGGFVRVKLAVRRRDAIDAIHGGKRELSPGYDVQLDATPGTHPIHGRYDAVQKLRRYNHLAIVDQARGGHEVRLRADSGIASSTIRRDTAGDRNTDTRSVPPTTSGGAKPRGVTVNPRLIPLLTLLGITQRADSDDAALELVDRKLRDRQDAAEKSDGDRKTTMDTARSEAARATAERDTERARADSEKARADKAELELQSLKTAEAERTDKAERVDLEDLAKDFDLDVSRHADTKALRKAIAEAHLGQTLRADASDEYVRALCDLASSKRGQRDDGRDAGRRAWDQTQRDDARTDGRGERQARLGPAAAGRARYDAAFQTNHGGAK